MSNQIASPPRLGRYGNDLNRVINGKRTKDSRDDEQETKLHKLLRLDNNDGNTISTPSVPVTPSFTLTTLVSPPSSDTRGTQVTFVRDMSNTVESEQQHQPSLPFCVQSSRGGRHNRGHIERTSTTNESNPFVPVSKRGRRRVSVSSRGGRAGKKHMVLPKKLSIPFTYGGDPSSLRPLSPRPN